MPKKASNLLKGGYDYVPKLDDTPLLNLELALWFALLIGMLRWMVENCRIDITT
jgi:hypothetical protein